MATDNSHGDQPFPFSVISGTKIAVAFLLSFFLAITLVITSLNTSVITQTEEFHIIGSIVLLTILFSILLQFRSYPHLWSSLTSPPQQTQSWNILFIVIPLLILSTGTGWLWEFLQLQFFPTYLENQWEWMKDNPLINTSGGVVSFIIVFISVAIIAPIVEELLFRGVIFDKISQKWNAKTGIFLSSLLFGLLHMEPIGASLFGAVMCLIYLRSRSLLIPIICHALNNTAAILLSYGYPIEIALFETKQQLYSQAWIGISLLLMGGISIFWWINKQQSLSKALFPKTD